MVPAKGPSVSVVRTTATTDSTGRTGGAASCSSSRQAARLSSKASAIQAHFLPTKCRSIARVECKDFRRLDQGPKGRAERPSVHDWLLIVERRSLRSALRAPVETTESTEGRRNAGALIPYGPVGLGSVAISTFWPGCSICTPALTTISPVCRPLETAIWSLV